MHDDRFQTLANLSPIGIFEADATGCCTFMNPVWEAICQQPVDKALGFGWLDVVHPDDRAIVAQPPPADSATPVEQHFRIIRPSGEIRSLRIRLGSVQSSPGVHVAWSGTFEDITDTLAAAAALRASMERHEVIAALGLVALSATSESSLLDQARAHVVRALNPERIEFAEDLGSEDAGAIFAEIDDPRHLLKAIVVSAREGCRFVEPDVHFLQSIANIVSAFIQRQHFEARARRRERWLRAYFDRSPDLVLRLDAQSQILDANPAAALLLGASVHALRGQSSRRLGLTADAFTTWCIAVSQVFESQRDQSLEVSLETARGRRLYSARLTAVADEDGTVEFVGTILSDVTERATAERELKHLQQELLERDDRLQSLVGSLMGERSVLRDRARAWGIAALTPRERTILRLLASGRTNREIAMELGLGAGTVKNRIGLLLPKLGAADRTQAVAIALHLGLLDGPAESTTIAVPEAPRPLPYFNLGEFE